MSDIAKSIVGVTKQSKNAYFFLPLFSILGQKSTPDFSGIPLNAIHKDYQGIGTSTVDTRDGLVKGHPSGGVAVLYRTKQAKSITPLYFNLDWVIGICIINGNNKHVILCVYMKTASGGHGDNRYFSGSIRGAKNDY